MSQSRPASPDLTGEEYRRECTLRNAAFIKARREFLKRWQSEPDLFAESIVVARKAEHGRGIDALIEQQYRERQFFSEFAKFQNNWPSITPEDVIGGSSTTPGPKVRLARYSPITWPRDGSLLLCVDPTATGEEIKKAWHKIKTALRQGKAKRLSGQRRVKLKVYDLYQERKGFREISRIVKKPVRTVYYLFASVCGDIGASRPRSGARISRVDPSFDTQGHFATCSECQNGRLCAPAEERLGLGQAPLREAPYGDISEAEKRSIRTSLGRKLPPSKEQ